MKNAFKTVASLLVCAMMFAACSSSSSPSKVVLNSYKAGEKAIEKMNSISDNGMSKDEKEKAALECFKEVASYYPCNSEKEIEETAGGLVLIYSLGQAFGGKVNKAIDYKVISEEINGDEATVTVKKIYEDGTEKEGTEKCVKTDKGWKLAPIKL